MDDLSEALEDPPRPCFLFGSTPPLEGRSHEQVCEEASKFCEKSWPLATDGYVVYDIQVRAPVLAKRLAKLAAVKGPTF